MSWIERARAFLDAARVDVGAWSYQAQRDAQDGAPPCAEPTCLVALALRVHGAPQPRAAAWLAGLQRQGGGVGAHAGADAPLWPTPLALWVWLAEGEGFREPARRAQELLVSREGKHWSRDATVGHDTSIVGWPWVVGTHSWVEPTSAAVCALTRAGQAGHPRVVSGRRLLLDRVVPGGGWNYGNTTVLGAAQRADPAPTGLALLATAAIHADDPGVQRSVAWLAGSLERIRSPLSLGWSLLGLEAAGHPVDDAPARLQASFARMEVRGPRVADVAVLLLAARAADSVALLGATP